MEVSFSKGETLKEDNVKIARKKLSFFSFSHFILFYFQFTFHIFLFIELRVSCVTQEERCKRF